MRLSEKTRNEFAIRSRINAKKSGDVWPCGCRMMTVLVDSESDGEILRDDRLLQELVNGDSFEVFEHDGDQVCDNNGNGLYKAVADPIYELGGAAGAMWSVRCIVVATGIKTVVRGK